MGGTHSWKLWCTEHCERRGITRPQLSGNSSPENSGPLFSGPDCHSPQRPVAQVCELDARPFAMATDAFRGPPKTHFPTICFVREVPLEDKRHHGTDNSSLASPGVVSSPTGVSSERFPRLQNLLTGPSGNSHPLTSQGKLQLVAWKVSGDSTLQ